MLRRAAPSTPLKLLLRGRQCGGQPQVLQRSLAGTLDLLSINLRHIVSSVKLRSLEVVYPNTWVAAEFREGVVAAFKHVNSLLDDGDFLTLRRLLSDKLLDDLKGHADLAKGLDYELRDIVQLGIFHAMAKADEDGFESVFVTPLLRVTEKYTLHKDPKVWWEVRRLHKWTFKRFLPTEGSEASEWQIVAMDKKRWRPEGLKDEE
ncbi:unnamed protein product [Effrenium voratum]|nr:unnamed protein product [Effrenium voratum]